MKQIIKSKSCELRLSDPVPASIIGLMLYGLMQATWEHFKSFDVICLTETAISVIIVIFWDADVLPLFFTFSLKTELFI